MNNITGLLKRLATSERVWSMLAAGAGAAATVYGGPVGALAASPEAQATLAAAGAGAGAWAVHVIQWVRQR